MKKTTRLIASGLNDIIFCANFDHNEKQTSYTYRELLAVKYVLSSFGRILKNQSIQVNTDNSSACRISTVGSSKTSLQNIVIDVFNFCPACNFKLIPQWIPNEKNKLADHYSRINSLTLLNTGR